MMEKDMSVGLKGIQIAFNNDYRLPPSVRFPLTLYFQKNLL